MTKRTHRTDEDAVALATESPLYVAKRTKLMAHQYRQLNSAFLTSLQKNVASAGFTEYACREYLRYSRQIQAMCPAVEGEEPAPGGQPFAVGSGDFAQLGLGPDKTEALRPAPLSLQEYFGDAPVLEVRAGGVHSGARTARGVFTWGVNDDGALGRRLPIDVASAGGTNQTGWTPGEVLFPADSPPCFTFGTGDSHTVFLLDDGSLWACGSFRDSSGAFGLFHGSAAKKEVEPVCVYSPPSAAKRAVQVVCGTDHALALLADGTVLSFGCAQVGRLGRLSEAEATLAHKDSKEYEGAPAEERERLERERVAMRSRALTPTPVPGISGVQAIGASYYASYVILQSGAVKAWGLNNYGQCALEIVVPPPPAAPAFYTPQDVPLLSPPHYRLVSITGGEHHALAVTERGDLLSFGRIFAGRLGRADVDATVDGAVFEPRAVTGFDGAVKTASAGLAVSAAITATGSMYAWGFGDTSQLGKGSDDSDEVLPYRLKPTRRFPATGGIAVAMGGQHGLWLAAAPADDWEEQGKTKTLKRSEE